MSTLTDSGVIQEVIDGLVTGEESTLGGAGYVKRLMLRVIEGHILKTTSRLGGRGKIIASVPLEIVYPTVDILTPVDATVTIPNPLVYRSVGAIDVDSVASGNGIVEIEGCWRIFSAGGTAITDPVDSVITIGFGDVDTSTGAIVIDSVADGDGVVKVFGNWSLT